MLDKLSVVSKTPVAELVIKDEVLVCWILPYYGIEQLKNELNSSQYTALSTTELPSEDLTWYLLIFSKDNLSRINLIDQYSQFEIEPSSGHCFSKSDSYQARPSNSAMKINFLNE
jgi:hypothetical protein